MFFKSITRTVLLLFVCVAVSACSTSPPARLYALKPIATAAPVRAPASEPRLIGIGPVDIPYYLDRNQIITRQAGNRYDLSEIDQWAEPIGDNVAGVVARNLSILVPESHPVVKPWVDAPVFRQVAIKIAQFDADANGEVSLIASWAVIEPRSRRFLVVRKSQIRVATAAGLENVLDGMSQALQQLSEAIAAALRQDW